MSTGSSINLIVPATPQQTESSQQGSSTGNTVPAEKLASLAKSVDIDKLKANLDQTLSGIGTMLSDIQQKIVSGWKLEEVTVHLAITGEGSIGIVTASVEAGIDITFTPVSA